MDEIIDRATGILDEVKDTATNVLGDTGANLVDNLVEQVEDKIHDVSGMNIDLNHNETPQAE